MTDFAQAWTTCQAGVRSAPNGPEHEHSTPTEMGDPDAVDVPGLLAAAALEVAFDDELLLDELLDEHALTEIAAARAAAMTTKILRRRRMELFLPHVSAALADHALTCTTVTCVSLASLRIVNKHSPCNGSVGHLFITASAHDAGRPMTCLDK